MGHIDHLRNQFKSINTFEQSYDCIIKIDKERKNRLSPFLKIAWSFFENTWVHFTQRDSEALCQIWLKLAQWFWRSVSKMVNVFLQFCYYGSLEWDVDFIWKKNFT